ncbi:hypothetical protein ABR737_08100 [Streptomyces sp. Edi2]|uniref:hypothetical protein n=1 Tax=Streptomyces sp. Edi2 TaxID=3162528 RepID=UPI003306359B
MWRFELDRRRFLTSSAYSVAAAALPLPYVEEIAERTAAAATGHTAGMADVAAVRDMVRVFSEWSCIPSVAASGLADFNATTGKGVLVSVNSSLDSLTPTEMQGEVLGVMAKKVYDRAQYS